MDAFAGASLYTSRWPKGGFDLTGKRVGVIGTGWTGVQIEKSDGTAIGPVGQLSTCRPRATARMTSSKS
jgi:hypothetical protein